MIKTCYLFQPVAMVVECTKEAMTVPSVRAPDIPVDNRFAISTIFGHRAGQDGEPRLFIRLPELQKFPVLLALGSYWRR